MTQHGAARRKEKARRNRMQRNGGGAALYGPNGEKLDKAQLPSPQILLVQLNQSMGIVAGLLETLCRIGLGQTAEDIEKAQGITFPIGPSKEELIEAMEQEMARLKGEQELEDSEPGSVVGFIESDDVVVDETELELQHEPGDGEAEAPAVDPYENLDSDAAAILAEAALDDDAELGGEG